MYNRLYVSQCINVYILGSWNTNHGSELRFIPPDLLEMLRICCCSYGFIEKRTMWRISFGFTRVDSLKRWRLLLEGSLVISVAETNPFSLGD